MKSRMGGFEKGLSARTTADFTSLVLRTFEEDTMKDGPRNSIFVKTSVTQFFVAALVCAVLTWIASGIQGPVFNALANGLGLLTIILVIAGIVKWLRSRNK